MRRCNNSHSVYVFWISYARSAHMLAVMLVKKRSLGRRILVAIGILFVVLFGAGWALVAALSKPLPRGETGARADELARSIERAIDKDAWERTGAVRWIFRGQNRHLWDRQRSLDRVIWDDVYVLCDLSKQTGVAFQHRKRVTGAAEQKLVAKAYASWINDAFWLNPLTKLFDSGVTRSVIEPAPGQNPGAPALLISYGGGGLTPGDSYLWLLPDRSAGGEGAVATGSALLRPRAWRMWVSIIPIKGVESSWDGWMQLATGAWVATHHQVPGTSLKLELTEVAGAASLKELVPGPDPFAPLMGGDVTLAPE